jgi:hypothetical protein
MSDGEKFQTLLKDEAASIYCGHYLELTTPCPNPDNPSETISERHRHLIYHYLRNRLVHRAEYPQTIQFVQTVDCLTMEFDAANHVLKMSQSWLQAFMRVVVFAEVNSDIFDEERMTRVATARIPLRLDVSKTDLQELMKRIDEVPNTIPVNQMRTIRMPLGGR